MNRRKVMESIAARAQARHLVMQARVKEMYAEEDHSGLPSDEEVQEHYATYGHVFDDACTTDYCQNIARIQQDMLAQSMTPPVMAG